MGPELWSERVKQPALVLYFGSREPDFIVVQVCYLVIQLGNLVQ